MAVRGRKRYLINCGAVPDVELGPDIVVDGCQEFDQNC